MSSRITNVYSLADETPLVAPLPGDSFPDDLDTTSLALLALGPPSAHDISSVLDLMAEYVDDDGNFLVRHRIFVDVRGYNRELRFAEQRHRYISTVKNLELTR